jgi:hypothetical protein
MALYCGVCSSRRATATARGRLTACFALIQLLVSREEAMASFCEQLCEHLPEPPPLAPRCAHAPRRAHARTHARTHASAAPPWPVHAALCRNVATSLQLGAPAECAIRDCDAEGLRRARLDGGEDPNAIHRNPRDARVRTRRAWAHSCMDACVYVCIIYARMLMYAHASACIHMHACTYWQHVHSTASQ